MKRSLLSLFILIMIAARLTAQTATDFTATDCNSASHNLFTELNAGKIIVLVWVMPCSNCISDAKASYDAVQSFKTSNPGNVIFWLSDDNGNTDCTNLSSWANTNGIATANSILFGNSGNTIKESDYGGSGMPHVVVLGGMNHKIYYNKINGSNDGTAITNAVTQALTTGINTVASGSDIKLYPNPTNSSITLELNGSSNTVQNIEIYNLLGMKIVSIIPTCSCSNTNSINIDFENTLAAGNYYLKVNSEKEAVMLAFRVVN